MALLKLGRVKEAREAAERGLSIEPGNSQLRELKDHITAKDATTSATSASTASSASSPKLASRESPSRKASSAAAGANIGEIKEAGNAAYGEKRFEEAVSLFSSAIALDPTSHLLYSNRAAAYACLGEFRSSLLDAERTVALKPDWAKGHVRLGAALFHLGRFAEARDAYARGLTVEPGNSQLEDGLRLATARLEEEEEEARHQISARQSRSPPYPGSPAQQRQQPPASSASSSQQQQQQQQGADGKPYYATRDWPDGRSYTGFFLNGRMHGTGSCVWPDGSTYRGEYQNGLKHGSGTFKWPVGHVYQGEYFEDKKHGLGKFTWANGTVYEGEFRDGVIAGHGCKVFPDGTRYVGAFEADRPHGRGTTTYPDGSTSADYYHEGVLERSVTNVEPLEDADALPPNRSLILKGVSGPVTDREWHISSCTAVIGSRIARVLVSGDTNMSSLNTIVLFRNGRFFVKDLNSVNGTAINGEYAFPPPKNNAVQHLLQVGDEIRISRTALSIVGTTLGPDNKGPLGLRVLVTEGPAQGKSFDIFKAASIGSNPMNEICLQGDTGISAFHVVIMNNDGKFSIKDLCSSQGTYLNRKRLPCFAQASTIEIASGSTLFLGSCLFEVLIDSPSFEPTARDKARAQRLSFQAPAQNQQQQQQQQHQAARNGAFVPDPRRVSSSVPYGQAVPQHPPAAAAAAAAAPAPAPAAVSSPKSSYNNAGGAPDPIVSAFVAFGRDNIVSMLNSPDPRVVESGKHLQSMVALLVRLPSGGEEGLRAMLRGVLSEYLPQFGARFPTVPADVARDPQRVIYEVEVWRVRHRMVQEAVEAARVPASLFMRDEQARAFWKSTFGDNALSAPLDEFIDAYLALFPELERQLRSASAALAALITFCSATAPGDGKRTITPHEFDLFLARFGPLTLSASRFLDLSSQRYYHGLLFTSRGAEELLKTRPVGAFLVRPSEANISCFVICVKDAYSVRALPIENTGTEGYCLLSPANVVSVPLGVRPPEPQWNRGPCFRRISDLVASNHAVAKIPVDAPPLVSASGAAGGGGGRRHNRHHRQNSSSRYDEDSYES
jgi:pSer/pThr/pTyr-binding forkhead associated (FHA) protein